MHDVCGMGWYYIIIISKKLEGGRIRRKRGVVRRGVVRREERKIILEMDRMSRWIFKRLFLPRQKKSILVLSIRSKSKFHLSKRAKMRWTKKR